VKQRGLVKGKLADWEETSQATVLAERETQARKKNEGPQLGIYLRGSIGAAKSKILRLSTKETPKLKRQKKAKVKTRVESGMPRDGGEKRNWSLKQGSWGGRG